MESHVLSTKNESPRMFKSDFLEYFSHINPATPLVVFVPVILFFLHQSFLNLSPLFILVFFLFGLLIWSLTEYLMHRFFFHYEFKSEWGKKIHFMFHGVHHSYPNDATRLVMPLAVSMPLAVFFYKLFGWATLVYQAPLFSGMVTGYLIYDMGHFAFHHFAMRKGVFRYLKQYHLKHHFTDTKKGFGVSNPLWDIVFQTKI